MAGIKCDICVVGGGLGGVAAAWAAARLGRNVVLTEETKWIGGQLTSQAVPPDEHPWIEKFGCTKSYRSLRNEVRRLYRSDPTFLGTGDFNPGSGWVSAICARPDLWHRAIENMLESHIQSGNLTVLTRTIVSGGSQLSGYIPEPNPIRADVAGELIRSITLFNLNTGLHTEVEAGFFLDATELGDLLELTGAEWTTGAEPDTGEPHASHQISPNNQQAITWVFGLSLQDKPSTPIAKPDHYEFWESYRPEFWPNPLFSQKDLAPTTNQPRSPGLPLISSDQRSWFGYRQIQNPYQFDPPQGLPTTIVNWPQNDYFLKDIIFVDPETRWSILSEAKNQSKCLLHWMQTQCPNIKGSLGIPELQASAEYLGSDDGFALTPYIRESRRIVALETIYESAVSAEGREGQKIAPPIKNSVGVGSYRIDLHPSTGGDAYIDLPTLPFQIPLGSLVPVRMANLLPACKNIGTTHVTNGCYRLHPVEWNIGEVAGLLAYFCRESEISPQAIAEIPKITSEFISFVETRGVETAWPVDRMS